MNWININDKMPECWSQHGTSFASGYLLTKDKYDEYQVNQYWEHGNGSVKVNAGWEEMDGDITHWCEIDAPKN